MPAHSSQLGVGCFPLVFLGVVFRPTMFAVTSEYSVLEKVLLMRERRLLAEQETDVDNNHLNTDCLLMYELQWHSESTAVTSRSQQHGGVI